MSQDGLNMAWDEPGQGRNQNKDPWKRPSRGGPPDLDKLLKDFLGKLKGGGGSGSGSGDSMLGGWVNRYFPYLLGSIFIVLYLLSGFYRVNPPERAVVTRFGHYQRIETPGLHWIPHLIEAKQILNVERIETTTHGGGMLTEDENIVTVEVDVQYRIEDPKYFLFNNKNPIRSLKEATESALRQVVGHLSLNDILTTDVSDTEVSPLLQKQELIKDQIQNIVDRYRTGLRVTTVAMKQPRVPAEVKDAFDDVIKAREDRETVQNTARSYANKIVPEAEGQAERLLREARGYQESVILEAKGHTARFNLILPEYRKAPRVTQTRLYLDTVQFVLANTSKVLVDLDSGSNNLLYLPLDRLLNVSGSSTTLPNLEALESDPNASESVAQLKRDKNQLPEARPDRSNRSARLGRRSTRRGG